MNSSDTFNQAKRVLEFLGLEEIIDSEIELAIDFSSFDNMRKMEARDKFKVKRLRPGNKEDRESYKVRKGKIGGYTDYLTETDIKTLNEKMRELSEFYDYTI
jgi:hypothetical protein